MRRVVSLISFLLVLVGAINWLLVGVTRFDLVRWMVGRRSWLGRLIYDLVGVAGLTQLAKFVRNARSGKLSHAMG